MEAKRDRAFAFRLLQGISNSDDNLAIWHCQVSGLHRIQKVYSLQAGHAHLFIYQICFRNLETEANMRKC